MARTFGSTCGNSLQRFNEVVEQEKEADAHVYGPTIVLIFGVLALHHHIPEGIH
jgi:hypothetical protein